MAITPKNVIGTTQKNTLTEKEFTDRESQRDSFFEAIDELIDNKNEYSVINFTGIGGIGKSALIKYIKEKLKTYEAITFSYADFSNIRNQNLSSLLFELSKSFQNDEINFYHFSVAYAIYFQKINKDIIFNANEHKIFNEDMGLVGEILSLIDKLKILGIIPNMVNLIYSKLYNKIALNKEIKEDLRRLETLEPSGIEEKLPSFFTYDIKEYLKYNKEKGIVIFLDTYEALYFNSNSEYSKYGKDAFIRELISQLPGVLFVICSRIPLDWENIDSEWEKVIKTNKIEVFSAPIANEFLKKCKVEEQDIREKMISVSMGLPYHLNILVDTYYEIKNNNIVPQKDLFASDSKKILTCFFKYLHNEEIAVIKILSVARFYDFDLFNYLMREFSTGYPITLFEKFNKNSYVNSSGNGIFHLHEIMRKDVQGEISCELLKNIHMSLLNYYSNLSLKISSLENKKTYIKETLYHAKYCMDKNDYSQYIDSSYFDFFKSLQNNGESKYLYDVLGDIFSYLNCSDSFELYEIYTDMIMLNGYFREAVIRIDDYLKDNSIEEISKSDTLLHLYVKKIKHQMVYSPLDSIILLIDEIKDFIVQDKYPHQYCELLYTKGNMLLEKGEFNDCLNLMKDLLLFSNEKNITDMQCRIYRKITDCYLISGDIRNAHRACLIGEKIAKNNNFKRYDNYLCCSLAEIQRKSSSLMEAHKIYTNCQNTFHELGINPWIAHTSLGLAEIALSQKDYQAVKSHLSIAKGIYNTFGHAWGQIHTELLEVYYNYQYNNAIDESKYNKLLKRCQQMGYHVVEQELIAIKNNKLLHNNILFL